MKRVVSEKKFISIEVCVHPYNGDPEYSKTFREFLKQRSVRVPTKWLALKTSKNI